MEKILVLKARDLKKKRNKGCSVKKPFISCPILSTLTLEKKIRNNKRK